MARRREAVVETTPELESVPRERDLYRRLLELSSQTEPEPFLKGAAEELVPRLPEGRSGV